MHAQQRQDHSQKDPGKRRVEQRDLDLRKDDIAKCLYQQVQTLEQRGRQRLAPADIGDALQGNDRAQHHADQQGHEHMRGVFAHQLQIAEVLVHPLPDGNPELGSTGWQVAVQERRQLAAGPIDYGHEFIQ